MAVYLRDFEDLSQACREFGGQGLAGFLADERISALGWPEDVVEQWLYEFAGTGPLSGRLRPRGPDLHHVARRGGPV